MENFNNLTEKHKDFCLAYIQTLNGSKAYQEVYEVKPDVAKRNGYRLLGNPKIKAAVRELVESYFESPNETRSRIQSIISFDIMQFWSSGKGIDGQALKDSGLGWLVKGWRKGKFGEEFLMMDKDKALEMMAKIQGLYSDALVQNNFIEHLEAENVLDDRLSKLRSKLIPD